ncbi:MAG: DUF1566 domain-containing protein [Bacteroidales bacterium]
MPKVSDIMPGKEVTIMGKGFAKEDSMYLTQDSNTNNQIHLIVTESTDNYIKFILPKDCAGNYNVYITRTKLTSKLDGVLIVPYLVVLDNVVIPTDNFAVGAEVTIQGNGFEANDSIRLYSNSYPENFVYKLPTTLKSNGVSFIVPKGSYGINNMVVFRGNRITTLGSIGIKANIGDAIGGGIVFWVDANQTHGLIANKINTGTPLEQFGPGVPLSGAAGTSLEIGTGKDNTAKLVAKMSAYRSANDNIWKTKESAAEQCDDLVVTDNGLTYDDWFLPSQLELKQVFLQKAMLATKGAEVPANNYWSSSEGIGDAAGWSAYYVNFYESTNYITGNSDKEGWKIGIRAIRSF